MTRSALICVAAITFVLGSCDKKSTAPVPPKPEIVYVATERYPTDYLYRVYYIDTETDSIVDSILRPGQLGVIWGVSPDGSKLYLHDGVIDTRTKADIAGARTGVPTPDGKYLIYSRPNPDTLQVIDARTNEVVFTSDTISLIRLGPYNFDTARGLVYGAIYDAARQLAYTIGVFDYRNLELVKVIDPAAIGGVDVLVGSTVISPDGKKLYYASGCFSPVFTCIDLERDTVESVQLLNGTMSLALTPDGQRIYVTDPGCYILPDRPPTGLIQIYSVTDGSFITPIDTRPTPNPCDSVVRHGLTDQIAMHPNGSKAYLSTYGLFSIMVIDILADTVSKVICGFGFVRSMAARRH